MRIYCQDIGKELGGGKCTMLIIRNGKQHKTEERAKKRSESPKKETYKFFGILEVYTIKQIVMKKKCISQKKEKTTRYQTI